MIINLTIKFFKKKKFNFIEYTSNGNKSNKKLKKLNKKNKWQNKTKIKRFFFVNFAWNELNNKFKSIQSYKH